jgi:hypothetical protein
MNIETIGFPVVFIVIISILLWFLIDAKGKWFVKAIVIACTLAVSLLVWVSVDNLLGWGTDAPLDGKYQLLWGVIEEPSKKTNDPGAIYVMVKHKDVVDDNEIALYSKKDKKEPRLFKLKYDKKNHKQMLKLMEKLKKGKKVSIGTKKIKVKGGNGPVGFESKQELVIYELPPPKVPRKEYLQN